jgi:ABC-type Fe3+/spermidine/putrescine transport system ATPase subunit
MSSLTIRDLTKNYGETCVVDTVSLAVVEGEFVSLLGPSGCGKTTILRMVAGLIEPSSGDVVIGERTVTRMPTHRRKIGLVFQSYALFPHLTVFENVAFGLKRQGVKGTDLGRQVSGALDMVRLGHLAERYPKQLSGGQQQRIALARAIAPRPSLLLLDEPLSNLDAQLRDAMQVELKRLQRELGITSLFVTHDQAEALSLSDRICILDQGRMQQFDTPEKVYRRQANGFVASFLGKPNRFTGHLRGRDGGGCVIGIGGGLAMTAAAAGFVGKAGEPVEVVVRQEDIVLSRGKAAAAGNVLSGTVRLRSFVGSHIQYVVGLSETVELIAEASAGGAVGDLQAGDTVIVSIDPAAVYVSVTDGAVK